MESISESSTVAFGRFRVLPHRRELLADGKPVKLGGRAFDVLMALIEARGAIVSKDALMAQVWPDRIVEENNLSAHILALRKAFGPDRELIQTIYGRGYRFTGKIRGLPAAAEARADPAAVASGPRPSGPRTNLPAPVSELIGRDEEIAEILNLATAHRLVTLTGAGGIGKTRLALALARELLPHFADGVWLAELSALADPGLVPATVAAAVGLDLGGGEPSAQRVAHALTSRRLLLVVDNCEHVIGAAAEMVEAVLLAGSAVQIIATSREPLRVEGERIYPVPPLEVPAEHAEADDDPLRCGAVQLFIERARAAELHFAPDRRMMTTITAVCRRLDGMPLAIELAAARAATLGIEELAARLDDRFHLLTGGRRTALPRHQTLRATLDWSYDLLAEVERIVLRRLAIFVGSFSLRAASVVVSSAEFSPSEVIDRRSNLVARSLVSTETDGSLVRYRLLDTTRAYSLEKLLESGEGEQLARQHAEYYRDRFGRAETELEARPAAQWLADYGRLIDNLRAALDWAFSPPGDATLGIALVIVGVPLWTHLSLMEECRYRVEQALACFGDRADQDNRCEMQLFAALGAALMYTRGATPETREAFARALEIADSLNDTDYRLRALWGLWVDRMNEGAVRDSMALAERFSLAASSSTDTIALAMGERTLGFAYHFLGDQKTARRHIERMFGIYVPELQHRPIIRFQFDPWLTARMRLAVILWLQGYPDQATHTVNSCIEEALSINHAVTLCNGISQGACPVALLTGDLSAAERAVTILLEHAEQSALSFWQADGRCFMGVLLIRRGNIAEGLNILRKALNESSSATSHTRYDSFLGELAEALGKLGEIPRAVAVLDGAFERTERTGGRWYVAELLRIRGELLLLQAGEGAASAAEDQFRQALVCAREQGALSWQLRSATSLARLLRDQGRPAEGIALLQQVYDRFTEGFDTTDLQSAKALFEVLR
jgi:predicted ATPase/DNA-binding winged helix-turn-helix (wHTH) protein